MTPADTQDSDLSALAAEAGIAEHWTDARQRPRRLSPDTLKALLAALALPAESRQDIRDSRQRLAAQAADALPPLLVTRCNEPAQLPGAAHGPYRIVCESGRVIDGDIRSDAGGQPFLIAPDEPGYHRLSLESGDATLAVAPRQAPGLADLTGAADPRCWGVSAQVYSLRQDACAALPRTHGFGDFGALRELAVAAAEQGADVLAISPVHAMFSAQPERCSPYSPSSRLFLNVLYAAPAAVLGQEALARALAGVAPAELGALDGLDLIDWPGAAAQRLHLLRALHQQFASGAPAALRQRYARFCAARGQALRDHALFESLHAARRKQDGAVQPWAQWPAGLRDPASAEVRRYAQDHPLEVDFHQFAQWLASENLAAAHAAGRAAGMRVGLLADLAVGDSPDGSHAWSRQADLMPRISIGAPPDIYNPLGQNWGLTAFSPRALHANGYAAFIDMLRASLAHTGGLRIDHILGMARLWLVPDGASPGEGAYLRYPLETLLALTALEAWRHRACAIGENLGTVPEGFDQRLKDNGLLGMNVLWFMRQAPDARPGPDAPAGFTNPAEWPAEAVAMTTTHDLPTLRGWWAERDIDWRVRLNLLGVDEDENSLRQGRAIDRGLLTQALDDASETPSKEAPLPALLRFVSSCLCPLLLVPMEDVAGVLDQPNLPGTIDTHPNWRQRLPLSIRATFADPAAQERLDAARTGRRRP
ncbi:4-alpha-glucanotransferase [Achromobacter deleyi]|uniref:4-alpha-glucanotransferase n=1 Tax=Achromobacter deleyi TaxID=1353891 RepID=UPI001492AF3D|nr:4-alpha-glucanotransferase [Achromobacter deleyi]QVQ28125.1 4-alpha-glucanotransferase [Achromobacter deleyi]UIP18313.1 4-alpha-glucanotransferase [Achromobacter deleyi]